MATANIARVATEWIESPVWSEQKSVPLLGPKDLTHDEMAAILSEALGRTVRYRPTSASDYIATMKSIGQSESAAQGFVDMFVFLTKHYTTPEDADRSLTPTLFRTWLQNHTA